VTSSVYSPDGTLIASGSQDNTIKVWDAESGAEVFTLRGHTGTVPGEYDPWAEDAERRRVQGPLWHAAEAKAAQESGNAFAAAFHRRRLAQGDNLRLLAWPKLAGDDHSACWKTIGSLRELCQVTTHLASARPVFAVLAEGPLHVLAGSPVSPLDIQQRRLAALLVRTAALLPGSGVPSEELLALARSGADADPLDWHACELFGAALHRDGKSAEAVTILDQAVRLHGNGGSLWAKLFLALAHQRLGQTDEAEKWRQKADKADGWEEQVMQFQLLGELDAAKRPAKP
jgi:hypothetical protein